MFTCGTGFNNNLGDLEFRNSVVGGGTFCRPNLPDFSDQAVFKSGSLYPSSRGGATYMMLFSTQHSKETVITWYRQALRMQRWQVDESTEQSPLARKFHKYVRTLLAITG